MLYTRFLCYNFWVRVMKNAKGKNYRSIALYTLVFVALVAFMHFGSQKKEIQENTSSAALTSFDDKSIVLTADQVSESYVVADVADTVSLPSAANNSANYVSVSVKYEIFGTTSSASDEDNTVQSKPTIMDTTDVSRGVIAHIVKEGETIDSIMAAHNITASKDQVRWSNTLKDENITPGSTIYLPSRPGVVYRISDGDSVESIARRYGAKAEEIISYNDLELSSLVTGTMILIPNGITPEADRPEYVAANNNRRSRSGSSRSGAGRYSYASGSGNRQNMIEIGSPGYWNGVYNSTKWQGNPGARGNCTWFAWYWRRNFMPENYWLPGGPIGNANAWYYRFSGTYHTGKTPQYGAIFQSTGGGYGHVGVVVGVNPGISFTVQEMNYAGPNGKYNHVYESTIDWSQAGNFNYIYGKK